MHSKLRGAFEFLFLIVPLLIINPSCFEPPPGTENKKNKEYIYSAWSPVWINNDRIVCFVGRTNGYESPVLCEFDAWTGKNSEVLAPPDKIFHKGNLASSRDKKYLVFDGAEYGSYDYVRQIYLFNRATRQITPITNESYNEEPTFSPDGSQVIFTSGVHFDDIGDVVKVFVQNIDGSDRHVVYPDLRTGDRWGRFLFDGKHVAMQSGRTSGMTDTHEAWEVYVMDPDGTNPIKIALGRAGSSYPYPSPTRNELLYDDFDESDGKPGFKIINLEPLFNSTVQAKQIFALPIVDLTLNFYWGKNLKWSPDGNWIAFRGSIEHNTPPYDLFLVSRTGGEFIRITNGMRIVKFDWSPDGKYIVFDINKSYEAVHPTGIMEVGIVNVQTHETKIISIQIPESLK